MQGTEQEPIIVYESEHRAVLTCMNVKRLALERMRSGRYTLCKPVFPENWREILDRDFGDFSTTYEQVNPPVARAKLRIAHYIDQYFGLVRAMCWLTVLAVVLACAINLLLLAVGSDDNKTTGRLRPAAAEESSVAQ